MRSHPGIGSVVAGLYLEDGQHDQKQQCWPAQYALVSEEILHLVKAVIACLAIALVLVGIGHHEDAALIALHPHRIMHRRQHRARTQYAISAIVKLGDSLHVALGLREMRHSSAARYRPCTRVVSREAQLDVAAIALHESL